MYIRLKELSESIKLSDEYKKYLFSLDESSDEYIETSKDKEALLFKVKFKNKKYIETFYMTAIRIQTKTMDMVFYNTLSEAEKDLDTIVENVLQATLF